MINTKLLMLFFYFMFLGSSLGAASKNNVFEVSLMGRLGNQFFQVAAGISLALDHGASVSFPDFLVDNNENRHINYSLFFKELSTKKVFKKGYVYTESADFSFKPIEYVPGMRVVGFFQSERYFVKYKDLIIKKFQPPAYVKKALYEKYRAIIDHPYTVGCHLRAYNLENANHEKVYASVGRDYVDRASAHFKGEPLFVIFSDNILWAKKMMQNFDRPHVFIENEPHYNDFALLSYCKHQIISNSSFSWWAAYINLNPDKQVIAPSSWFHPSFHAKGDNIVPSGWMKVDP